MDNAEMKLVDEATSLNDVVSLHLSAPLGWSKKLIPKKSGTPRRNEVMFISPTGEEIKNKRQLDQYLKSHSGGPSATEFDWTTGDTPRRSTRLSSKPKEAETPESEPSLKKQKRSSSKKGEQKKEDPDEKNGSADDETPADNTEAGKDAEMDHVEVQDSVHNPEGKADEIEELGHPSDAVRLSDANETKSEDTKPQGEPEQGIDQKPEETCDDTEEKPVENMLEASNTDVLLPEKTKATEEQPSEKKEGPEKVLAEAEVHPAAESASPAIEIGVNDVEPAGAKTEIDGFGPGQEDLEKKAYFEEVGPNSNSADRSHEAADHSEHNPIYTGNLAPESHLF